MNNVRKRRKQRKWTQAKLARAAGVSQPVISIIESGYNPTSVVKYRIARALGTTVEDLWRG